MSKAASKFQKRTGFTASASGGMRTAHAPYHAARPDLSAGTVQMSNGVSPVKSGSYNSGALKAACPICRKTMFRVDLARHVRRKHPNEAKMANDHRT